MPGESDDAFYARTGIAGLGKSGEELYKQDQERVGKTEIGKILASTKYNGPIKFTDMTDEEVAFLMYVSSNYRFDPKFVTTQFDCWTAIGNGSLAEMNAAIARADKIEGHGGTVGLNYPKDGRLRALVDDVANGRLKPEVTHG